MDKNSLRLGVYVWLGVVSLVTLWSLVRADWPTFLLGLVTLVISALNISAMNNRPG
jgi:hypothetical protein